MRLSSLLPTPSLSQPNADNLRQVAQIMGSMVFVDDDLDLSWQELKPALTAALGLEDPALLVVEPMVARVVIAQALSLAGALHHLHDTSDLVGLMRGAGFLNEDDDDEDIRTIKALVLDKALQAAIVHAEQAMDDGKGVQVARFKELRERAEQIMWAYGCAAQCYAQVGQ